MLAFPKPQARAVPVFRVYDGGREVCSRTAAGKAEYQKRLRLMTERQQGKCAICQRMMGYPTFDHECSRGGGKQDDRIWEEADCPEDTQRNAAVCLTCNTLKGSKRYAWQGGVYCEVTK